MDGDATGGAGDNQLTVDVPTNLLVQIDAQVGTAFVDRAEFVRTAIRQYLEYIQESQNATPSDIG